MHGLKSAMIGHALLVQPPISAHRKWPEIAVSGSTKQVWAKTSSVEMACGLGIQNEIQAV